MYLLSALAVEDTTKPGPAADLEASDPASKSAPASQDSVDILAKPSEHSCSSSSKDPQDTANTHFALCLVRFLKSSGPLVCFSVT